MLLILGIILGVPSPLVTSIAEMPWEMPVVKLKEFVFEREVGEEGLLLMTAASSIILWAFSSSATQLPSLPILTLIHQPWTIPLLSFSVPSVSKASP